MDPFRKVQRGDRVAAPSAVLHNATVDAVRSARSARTGGVRRSGDILRRRHVGEIFIRNDTGTTQDRFAILAIRDPLFLPDVLLPEDDDTIVMGGAVPEDSDRAFAVLQEPLADGAVGRAVAHGFTLARVTGSHAQAFADLQSDDTGAFATDLSGAERGHVEVLARATSDSDLSCVRIGNGIRTMFEFGVLRTLGATWSYDRYGSTIDSLSGSPGGIGSATAAEQLLFAGELVLIDLTEPTTPLVRKFFRHPLSYTIPEGLVGLRMMTMELGGPLATSPTRVVCEATTLIDLFESGANEDRSYVEVSFGGYGGVSLMGLDACCPVLLGSGWNLGTASTRVADVAAAQAAVLVTIPGALDTSQDSWSVGLHPDSDLEFAGANIAYGENHPADYKFDVDYHSPYFPPVMDGTMTVTTVYAEVGCAFQSALVAGWMTTVPALLPTIPYVTPGAEELVPLGIYFADITAEGNISSLQPATKVHPGFRAYREMPSGLGTAAGLYDKLPVDSQDVRWLGASLPGDDPTPPQTIQIDPEITVS